MLDLLLESTKYLTEADYVSVYGGEIPDAETLESWRADMALYRKERREGKLRDAADVLYRAANRGQVKEAAEAFLQGQHPYLVDELVVEILRAMDRRWGQGYRDGRITPALLEVGERLRV